MRRELFTAPGLLMPPPPLRRSVFALLVLAGVVVVGGTVVAVRTTSPPPGPARPSQPLAARQLIDVGSATGSGGWQADPRAILWRPAPAPSSSAPAPNLVPSSLAAIAPPDEVLDTVRPIPGDEQLLYGVGVPPGDYEIQVWIAASNPGTGSLPVHVAVNGKTMVRDVDMGIDSTPTESDTTLAVGRFGVGATDAPLSVAIDTQTPGMALAALAVVPARPGTPAVPRFYVTPDGESDGTSWSRAASLDALPELLARASGGDEIWISADDGPYELSNEVVLEAGGDSAQERVVVRGVGRDGRSGGAPRLQGNRARPFDPDGSGGSEVFRLLEGADHLRFENLAFADVGNGAFRIGGDIRDVAVSTITASNVGRLIENYPSGKNNSATIRGLALSDTTVNGFSRSVVRLGNDSSDIVLSNITGDSQGNDGEDFAIGVHLEDTVHDVAISDVIMRNARDSSRGQDDYWNGDGFATEGGVANVTFRDTLATGNSDAGYDLKSSDTRLFNVAAAGNKRNFRLWNDGTSIDGCTSWQPLRRGGNGSQAHVHVPEDARASMTGCRLAGDSLDTVVFHVEQRSVLTVRDTTVEHHREAEYARVENRAELIVK